MPCAQAPQVRSGTLVYSTPDNAPDILLNQPCSDFQNAKGLVDCLLQEAEECRSTDPDDLRSQMTKLRSQVRGTAKQPLCNLREQHNLQTQQEVEALITLAMRVEN